MLIDNPHKNLSFIIGEIPKKVKSDRNSGDITPFRISTLESVQSEIFLDEQEKKHIESACELLVKILIDTDPNKTLKRLDSNQSELRIYKDKEKNEVYIQLDAFISSIKRNVFSFSIINYINIQTDNLPSNLSDMNEDQIIAYLEKVTVGDNKFSTIRGLVDPDDMFLVIKNANNIIESLHQKEQNKILADYNQLLKVLNQVLDQYKGSQPIDNRYYHIGTGTVFVEGDDYRELDLTERTIVSGSNTTNKNWKELGVSRLLYTIQREPYKSLFISEMESLGYNDPFFGSVNDGDYLHNWIEFSWKSKK